MYEVKVLRFSMIHGNIRYYIHIILSQYNYKVWLAKIETSLRHYRDKFISNTFFFILYEKNNMQNRTGYAETLTHCVNNIMLNIS